MLSRSNFVLAVLFVVILILAVSSHVDYARPNLEILPDMKYTPAYTAYAENPNFPNGRTLQAPMPGTIARGSMPFHYEATEADARRAGEQLHNPTWRESTDSTELSQSILQGGAHYRVFCVSCHGPGGAGDGPIPKRGFPPPPSLLTGKSVQMKDGQLFHILTLGQGSMAGFAGQLSPAARWDVVNYVRSLQPEPAEQTSAAASAPHVTGAERGPSQMNETL